MKMFEMMRGVGRKSMPEPLALQSGETYAPHQCAVRTQPTCPSVGVEVYYERSEGGATAHSGACTALPLGKAFVVRS